METRSSDIEGLRPSADEVDELRAENERLRAENARLEATLAIVFDSNPDGIAIVSPEGSLSTNAAAAQLTGAGADGAQFEGDWTQGEFGFFHEDGETPMTIEETPLMRAAMRREQVVDCTMVFVTPDKPEGTVLLTSARPLPSGGAVAVFRDVTDKVQLEHDLRARNAALSEREEENRRLIERLRIALDELSTPVLEVAEDVLVLPVIGLVDTQRSAQMSERLLSEVVRTKSRFVIVDLTGVDLIDTSTADRFAKLARAVELLGARCVVSGLQPAVAQTLVELGVEFGNLVTERNLRHALEHCLAGGKTLTQRTVVRRSPSS